MRQSNIMNMVLCTLFAALIAVGAFLRIPVPMLPITLQVLFTNLAGMLLGKRLGMISVCLYLLLGLIGLPVFTEGGGIFYIFKPSFGYLIGFAVGAYVTGMIANKISKPEIKHLLIANLAGLSVIYIIGMIYYYLIYRFYLNSPIGISVLLIHCFLMVIPGDLVLCFVGAWIGMRLIPFFRRNGISGK